MDESDSRRILWENVQTLMNRDFGGEHLGQVAQAGGLSASNMTRIKAMDTDVSLLVLRALSRAFTVPVWQLLTPNLGAHLHVIEGNRIEPLFDPKVIGEPESRIRSSRQKAKKNERHQD